MKRTRQSNERVPAAFDIVPAIKGLLERLTLKNVMPSSFVRLVKELGIQDDQRIVIFFQGIMAIIRKLPDKSFADDKTRQKILTAIQDAIDEVIERLELAEEEATIAAQTQTHSTNDTATNRTEAS